MSDRKWEEELVERLIELADPLRPNRAALAHLRRGLASSPVYTLARAGWLFRRVPDSSIDHAVVTAGLFALVAGNCPHARGENFGAAFGAKLTLEEKQQREKRFIDLLDTDAEELSYKLRQAVTLLAREGVGFDWAMLMRHLGHWGHPERWVQKEWARGFWTAGAEPAVDRESTVSE